jgi:hypothetical protein
MSREFLEEFIKIYDLKPYLWQVKSKLYHDIVKKESAYTQAFYVVVKAIKLYQVFLG